jgi:ureidoacrylate peracid hydrolase
VVIEDQIAFHYRIRLQEEGKMTVSSPHKLLQIVDLANSAVLVVDIQNDWCHEDGVYAKGGNDVAILQDTVPKVEELLAGARRYKVPIVHIKTTHSRWTDSPSWRARLPKSFNIDTGAFLKPGSWGAEFYKIVPQDDEYIVTKHRYSAFVDTDLDLALRSTGIRTIIMTGFASNVCVQATALHGFMRDYYVVILEDCTATFSTQEHRIALTHMHTFGLVTSNAGTIIEAWKIGVK